MNKPKQLNYPGLVASYETSWKQSGLSLKWKDKGEVDKKEKNKQRKRKQVTKSKRKTNTVP